MYSLTLLHIIADKFTFFIGTFFVSKWFINKAKKGGCNPSAKEVYKKIMEINSLWSIRWWSSWECPVVVPKLRQDKRKKILFEMGSSRTAAWSSYFYSSVSETKKIQKVSLSVTTNCYWTK